MTDFAATRPLFHLPPGVYLDGNSLGPLPTGAIALVGTIGWPGGPGK